jgi:hypothetical protein
MKKLLPISIEFSSILKALAIALPFSIVYILEIQYSMMITVTIVALFGIYFLLGLYILRPIQQSENIL